MNDWVLMSHFASILKEEARSEYANSKKSNN